MKTLLSILFGSILAFGGPTASAGSYWFSPGIGGSSAGLAYGLGFSHASGHFIFSGRFVRSDELPPNMWGVEPEEHIQDLGVLFGLVGRSRSKPLASVSMGLGYVSAVRRGRELSGYLFRRSEYEKISYSGTGLLLEVDCYVSARLGLTVFGNINKGRSCAGVLLCGRIGKFK